MKKLSYIISIIMALVSCTKEEMKIMYSSQEEKITSYIDAQMNSNPDFEVVYNDGIARLTVAKGTGDALTRKGTAVIYLAVYNFSTSAINKNNLAYTNMVDIASEASLDTSDESAFEPVKVSPSDDGLLDGLAKGLVGIKAGEECYIIFSGQHGFKKDHVGTIPANTPLAFHIWVMEINNE